MALGKVAVLGGGPGAHAVAGDLALRGFEVHLWARNPYHAAAVFANKKITLIGGIEGTAKLANASNNMAEIVKGAKLVIVPLSAPTQHEMATQLAPLVEDGQVIMTSCQGGLGSVEYTRVFREKGVKKNFICAEYPGLPHGARFLDLGVVNVSHGNQYGVAAFSKRIGVFPAKRTEEAMAVLTQVYPGTPAAKNSLASALVSRGIIHQPIAVLTSLSAIDMFVFWDIMEEGMSVTMRKLTTECDNERKAIEAAWGFSISKIYHESFVAGNQTDWQANNAAVGTKAKVVRWAWKDRLDDLPEHRYLSEAVPFGLVQRASAARRAGVPTPIHDSVITLMSTIAGVDYNKTGRTLDAVGLKAKTVEETNKLLENGWD